MTLRWRELDSNFQFLDLGRAFFTRSGAFNPATPSAAQAAHTEQRPGVRPEPSRWRWARAKQVRPACEAKNALSIATSSSMMIDGGSAPIQQPIFGAGELQPLLGRRIEQRCLADVERKTYLAGRSDLVQQPTCVPRVGRSAR